MGEIGGESKEALNEVERKNSNDMSKGEGELEHRPPLSGSFDQLPPAGQHKKSRLFGRQKPVHSVLGGGKPADVILWRNKQISASMLAASTVIWLLFEWIGYHLLTFVCHSLILTLAALFLWSNLSSFLNKSPPVFPEVAVSKELSVNIALLLRDRSNKAFSLFWNVASGKDLKKFLYVILGLWITSVVGSWFSFLTLVYIMFVGLLTVPMLYEKNEDKVDTYAEKATGELKKKYKVLDKKVIRKFPKMPFTKDNNKPHSREVKRFVDLTDNETSDLWTVAQKVGKQLECHHKASSLTFAIQDGPQAGQTVPHVHIHIIPRKGGDFENNDEIYEAMDEKEKELKQTLDLDKERKDRTLEEMAHEAEEYRKLFL